jgi:hypothetical protein
MKFSTLAAFASILAIVGVAAAPAAWASRITLNDTGMSQCIDHQGDWSSECAKSHQDAEYGRDVNDADPDDGVAGFSFQKVCRSGQMAGEGTCPADPALGSGPDDWGCTYDNISQLTWEVKTTDGGVHDGRRTYTNKGKAGRLDSRDAAWLVIATNAEHLCGSRNWKLPEVSELQSIVNYGMGAPGMHGPYIDPNFFPDNVGGNVWTGVRRTYRAWYVNFGGGDVDWEASYEQATARLVHGGTRPLSRGRATLAKYRFWASEDGTEVTDTRTGLVWRRCAAGMVWNIDSQACLGTATEFQWKEALDYAKTNRQGGWRLPNVKELFSITDHEVTKPAIDSLAFPNTPTSVGFLSSTPMDNAGDLHVQLVLFNYGSVERQPHKGNSWALRLVRRGRE